MPIPISADAVHAAYLAMARFPDKRFSLTKLGKNQPIYGVKLPYLKPKISNISISDVKRAKNKSYIKRIEIQKFKISAL